VYDYFVDEETGNFSLWEDRIDLRPRADVPSDSSYVALHQVSFCFFFRQEDFILKIYCRRFHIDELLFGVSPLVSSTAQNLR